MLPSYDDILVLAEEAGVRPQWWDGNGVPRFAEFTPDMLGVYDELALLVEIRCQACPSTFLVGEGWSSWSWVQRLSLMSEEERETWRKPTLADVADGYHYGDPPRHGTCAAGDTMNCIDLRIVQAWDRQAWVKGKGYEWVRNPDVEAINIRPDWAEEL